MFECSQIGGPPLETPSYPPLDLAPLPELFVSDAPFGSDSRAKKMLYWAIRTIPEDDVWKRIATGTRIEWVVDARPIARLSVSPRVAEDERKLANERSRPAYVEVLGLAETKLRGDGSELELTRGV